MTLAVTSFAASFANGRAITTLPAFIPAFSGITGTSDALTAALLFSLYRGFGSPVLLFSAAAYLINALLIVPYALTFPGVIDSHGFIGTEQSAVWLWLSWHFSFPMLVAVCARGTDPERAQRRVRNRVVVIAACLTFSFVAALIVTVGQRELPILLHRGVFSSLFSMITFAASLTNIGACFLVANARRPLPILHMWLVVALAASALDAALNAIAPARYSLPWYIGKAETLASASIVLIALLGAWTALQKRAFALSEDLARTVADRRILQEQLAREVEVGVLRQRAFEAEKLFNLVVERAPSAMLLIDEHGHIALANAEAEKLFDYRRDELLGRAIGSIIPERTMHDLPHLMQYVDNRSAMMPQLRANLDVHCVRRDGTQIPVDVRVSPIRSEMGSFVLAAISDISERKAAEQLRLLQAETQRHAAEIEAERERKMSTAFQRAVLPATLPNVSGCEFDAVYEPGRAGDHIGGDWYDVVHLVDGRVFFAVGDVAGSGLDASVVVGVARQVMRGIAQLHANPSVILDAADRALCLEYPGIYVSAWVGLIDLVTRTVTYASAGHPPPFIVTERGDIRELSDPTTMLIGLREGHRGQPNILELGPRDTFVLYTNGVVEASRDLISGIGVLHTLATRMRNDPSGIASGMIRQALLPNGSSDDAAILVVRSDCTVAEAFIQRWTVDSLNRHEAALVRHELILSLRERGFLDDDCSNAELVFGELIGNVVRHAGMSSRAEVALDHGGPHSVLHVMDRGAGFYHIGRLPRDPYAETGRGLFLIGALSVDFTVSERPDGGSHARVVLFGGPSSATAHAKHLRLTAMT